ncbi:Shr3 amino acid permease chaperone [Trichodelitschia bisporula]|uniref:Shr3 amino acid permease chaperone n=1 Tax=Trichodelitschia bisporula TaxID=703511 RepID=A0A6G1IB38_9PEZI|nr:Shr3 amino acid permease chaperone [Trichodelitschia bisporula]
MPAQASSFATFLIIGPTCFFLGILFILLPYDYYVLWSTPLDRAPYFDRLEAHLRFLHSSPPLISRILHIAIGTGLLGFITKLYKPSEANMLFDGASLVLYMCAITVYIANVVKGLRVVTAGAYGTELVQGEAVAAMGAGPGQEVDVIGREDSLRVLAASNTILALVLIGVLVLQAGQWYALHKEEAETEEMETRERAAEKRKLKKKN